MLLPGVVVAGDDDGREVLLGRNVLNKLILCSTGRAMRLNCSSGSQAGDDPPYPKLKLQADRVKLVEAS